ncbi:uncharacterized protein LOC100749525 isoform X10 [Bombus impatiens]|uniref:Uncharacterized protein LOC100749525 isoform X10 n=1 Tax=Bombus impatiens TaxID=132113 RepID=A0A6P8KZ39_BOMIM|nr:uncharacterized protein LOC100749525 isoform X10 [Bombus impatiens]
MICHTDAVVGNRTTRDNDDEDADGDEDHGSIQRRVDASTSLDDARMRASLEADDKTRTNKTVRCRVASTCPVERRANWSSSTGFQAAYRSSPIVIVLYAVTNGINSSDRNSSSGTSNSQWKIRKREHGIIYARRRRTRVVVASCADYQVSDDSPRTLQPSRSRRKDAISRRNERCRAASDPRRGTSSAASSVLRRPARRAKLLAIRPSRARSYLTSVMAAVPDMSHLTPEERSTIEEVIIRQKQEEEKENEIMRRKQDEVTILEERIRACSEKHKKAGVELHATCHICLKTKFADGVGHICNYCSIRCCARCGGKVTLRSNKVIWVCILCRKKQELLSKTGQWITKAGLAAGDNAMLRRMQDMQGPGRRLPTSDSGVDMSVSPHSRSLPTPHVASPHQMQQPPRHPDAYAEDDPNLYRGEIDGLMKQQNYQRQRPIYPDQNTDLAMTYGQPTVEAGPPRSAVHPTQQHSVHQTQSAHPPQPMGGQVGLQPQRSFSSSEEERSTPECASDEPDESEKELYDARREKPSVLVTSPGSPDLHAQGRARHLRHTSGNANVGGNLQVKLSFDSVALRLIVTLICAAGLTPRSNGQPRNPYAKIFLLPDKSEKSKRRTKTLANTNDPKWNQTFIYDGIRRPELRKRALEVTVWDYGKYDTNDFLGEAILELATAHLDEEPEWHPLTGHGEHRHIGYYQEPDDMVITPVDCHLSPPSTTSRLSDSDTSECDITDCDVSREQRRTADGASISSIGSSSRFHNMPSNYKRHYSSPPPERELCIDGEHRSRRDMSPQGRKRAAIMIRDQPASISGYQTYRKDDIHRGMMGHRSHSAAPMDSPSLRYRGRSQSPTGHRSLSPPEHRSMLYSHGYVPPRFSSRSATATPTGSPKKRQLPLIPTALKERAVQDPEERARFMRHRNRQVHTTYRSTGTGGWEKHYSGLSDSDLLSIDQDPLSLPHSHPYRMHRPRRGNLSPDKDVLGDLGDSDMESIASVTSSAFSTQSERPRGSRGLIPTVKNVLIPGVISPMPLPPRRNRRRHRLRVPCSECHCPNNNPTKPRSNNPSKHNPTPHPLVRSKSAVVRSLYRKMRTPFTRSQTVDENMLRYYSPETSEYSVSEGYLLKPEELTGSSKNRIPEIYVEDCLQVDFNDRLIEKFRDRYSSPYQVDSGMRRRSRSWQDRTGRTAKSRHHLFSRGLHDLTDDHGIRNLDVSLRPRRSFLFSKARSFDYDVLHDTYADRYGFGLGTGMLSRRAKSFEYDTISSNIFSDDSLRTARRKLKKNMAINDAGYGDKIPALGDQSKSYFDSNSDDKMPKILLNREKNYDYMLKQDHKPFYGYDSEFSCGETEIYMPRFDKQNIDIDLAGKGYHSYDLSEENSFSSDDQIGLRNVLGREDPTKRKYRDSTFQEHDSAFGLDISKKRTKNLDSDICDPANEHIYCSIDEALSSAEKYGPDRDITCSSMHAASDLEHYDNQRTSGRSRRRRKSSESYLENGYDGYNWDIEYDEGFIDRGNVDEYGHRLYDYEDENIPRTDAEMYEDDYYRRKDSSRSSRRKKRSSQYVDADYIGDYRDYRSAEEYDYQAHSGPECVGADAYQDNTLPRRRKRRSRRGSREVSTGVYENLPYRDTISSTRGTLTIPSLSDSKRMMLQRAESTPILRSDEELSSSDRAERARRLYRRKRNSSCPEARELRYYDPPRRKDEERSTNFILDSDEDFGSMETVVCADCFRQKNVTGTVVSDGIRSGYYDGEQVRDGYVDSRYDYENVQTRDYREPYELARSGSLRSSSQYRGRRKTSCPECRELAMSYELGRSGSFSRKSEERRPSVESRHRYRRRNSSCPEPRDLELLEKRQQQQRHQQAQQHPSQQQQQGSKRNVAISDTLEYYEYSMESESQCSENCGFGPCDPRRPRNRAPHPGNANSSLFDSQTATSDTTKNYHPRAVDHHETSRNTKLSRRDNFTDTAVTSSSSPTSSTRRPPPTMPPPPSTNNVTTRGIAAPPPCPKAASTVSRARTRSRPGPSQAITSTTTIKGDSSPGVLVIPTRHRTRKLTVV